MLQLEKHLEKIYESNDYKHILEVKRQSLLLLLSSRDIGLTEDLSFLHILLKLHDVFLESLLADVERRVKEVLAVEDYQQIQVFSHEDIHHFAEKYEFHIPPPASFPSYLPYSLLVMYVNDLIRSFFQENFDYFQFLIRDQNDVTITYNSCDRIIKKVSEVLTIHFCQSASSSSQGSLNIQQRVLTCNNIEYLIKSFPYHKRTVQRLTGSFNEFQFQGEQDLWQLRQRVEETVYSELRVKLNEFMAYVEPLNWAPKQPN